MCLFFPQIRHPKPQIDITAPGDIGEWWAKTVAEKKRGQEIISTAVEARHGIGADLKAAKFTNEDKGNARNQRSKGAETQPGHFHAMTGGRRQYAHPNDVTPGERRTPARP